MISPLHMRTLGKTGRKVTIFGLGGEGGFVGGLIGKLWRPHVGGVSNSYATGKVTPTGESIGGLIGGQDADGSEVIPSASYYDLQTSGQTKSAGGEGKTTADMKTKSTYAGWDFDNVWNIQEGVNYPTLRSVTIS